jgi:regulator of cell morphogenesis and NO signaling
MNSLNELSNYGNGRIVLNRYNYFGGLSEQPVMEFCEDNGINLEFVHILWEAFQTNSVPDAQRLMQFETSMVLEYLEKTHAYYLERLIPEIELNIYRFAEVLGIHHPVIKHLISHFDLCKQDLVAHIQDEELFGFTYAKQLLINGVSSLNYKIAHFESEHEHKEEQLGELLHFLKSNVSECEVLPFKMILSKLELLQRDLFIHASVEDEVLVPKVRLLEGDKYC